MQQYGPADFYLTPFISELHDIFNNFEDQLLKVGKDGSINEKKLDKFLSTFSDYLKKASFLTASNKELAKEMEDLKKVMKDLKKLNVRTAITTSKMFVDDKLSQSAQGTSSFFDVSSKSPVMKSMLNLLSAQQKRLAALTKAQQQTSKFLNSLGGKLSRSFGAFQVGMSKLSQSTASLMRASGQKIAGGFRSLIGFLGSRGFHRKLSDSIFRALAEAKIVKGGLRDLIRLGALLLGSYVKKTMTGFLSRFMSPEKAQQWGGIAGGAAFLGSATAPIWIPKLFNSGFLGKASGALKGLAGGLFSYKTIAPKIQTISASKAFQTLNHGDIFKDAATGEFSKVVKGNGFVTATSVKSTAALQKAAQASKALRGLGPVGIAIGALAEIPALFKAKKEGKFGAQLAESGGGLGGAIVGGAIGAFGGPVGIAIGAVIGDFIGRTIGKGMSKYMAPIGESLKTMGSSIGRIFKSLLPVFVTLGKVVKVVAHPLMEFLKLTGKILGWLTSSIVKKIAKGFERFAQICETIGGWFEKFNQALDKFAEDHPYIASAVGIGDENPKPKPGTQAPSTVARNVMSRLTGGLVPSGGDLMNMKDLNLAGEIWSGNSDPRIRKENGWNMLQLDSILKMRGFDVKYTSNMGGRHAPNSEHYLGNKVDLQVFKNGKMAKIDDTTLGMLKALNYFGSHGAIGYETQDDGKWHYDFYTGKGIKAWQNDPEYAKAQKDYEDQVKKSKEDKKPQEVVATNTVPKPNIISEKLDKLAEKERNLSKFYEEQGDSTLANIYKAGAVTKEVLANGVNAAGDLVKTTVTGNQVLAALVQHGKVKKAIMTAALSNSAF